MSQIQLINAEKTVLGQKGEPTEKAPFLGGNSGGRYWIRTSDPRLVRPTLFR